MILLEEWIASARDQLDQWSSGHLEAARLGPNLQSLVDMLDPDEIQGYPECAKRLDQFLQHYARFEDLDTDRQHKRIENGQKMLQKLTQWYLFPPESSQETPVMVDCDKLNQPLQYLKGIGPRREKLLQGLDIHTVTDLIETYPRTYDDRRKLLSIRQLRPMERATVIVQIVSTQVRKISRGREIFEAVGSDGFSQIILTWFNQGFLRQWIQTDDTLCVTGVPKWERGSWEMAAPDYEKLEDKEDAQRKIYPVYRLTAGLYQKQMRLMMREVMKYLSCVKDPLPKSLIEQREFMPLQQALEAIHSPSSFAHLNKGKERLIYDEFFFFQLCMQWLRKQRERSLKGVAKQFTGSLKERLIQSLGFQLTQAQKDAVDRIEGRLRSETVMNLLLQGDVGSGKTAVAEIAMVNAVEAGFQAVMMVPTSILAQQQYERIRRAFDPLGIECGLLISKMSAREKKQVKEGTQNGTIAVVMGTHALIQEDVSFSSLGLVVVDEQHRFGVRQREALKSKGHDADTLVMTATPIPRTLALSIYGDLEVVTIDELPKERKPVKTVMVNHRRAPEVWRFVREEADKGHQAFFVYPIIEESEQLELKAATTMYKTLKTKAFQGYELGLLHGRMTQEEKDEVMLAFANARFPILVSTTVIEVGIDIPEATVMVIEHPERFGLSQLHQLRGRVGRSDRKSYCFLIANDSSEETYKRLKFFADTRDGFALSEYDLKTRGPGEFLGLRQHGLPDFRLGNLIDDGAILGQSMKDAISLLDNDPDLERLPEILKKLRAQYGDRMKWVEVG